MTTILGMSGNTRRLAAWEYMGIVGSKGLITSVVLNELEIGVIQAHYSYKRVLAWCTRSQIDYSYR